MTHMDEVPQIQNAYVDVTPKTVCPWYFLPRPKVPWIFFAFGALTYMRQFRISQEKHLSSGFQNSLL